QPGLPPPVAKTNHVVSFTPLGSPETVSKTNPKLIAKSDAPANSEKSPAVGLAKDDEDSDESLDDKVPNLDIPLEEAKRIMSDYVTLASKQDGVAVTAEKK